MTADLMVLAVAQLLIGVVFGAVQTGGSGLAGSLADGAEQTPAFAVAVGSGGLAVVRALGTT